MPLLSGLQELLFQNSMAMAMAIAKVNIKSQYQKSTAKFNVKNQVSYSNRQPTTDNQ